MKSASGSEKKLAALLKRLPEAPPIATSDDAVDTLVRSFLMWESTTEKALKCYEKLMAPLVDHNDLRVTMPREMAEQCSDRTVAGLDRFRRLRAVLRNVYLREHAVTLDRVKESGKRDARKYLDSLEGMVPYVAARVLLLCLEVHAIPADEQLANALADEGVIDAGANVSELSSWLARHTRAGQGLDVHARFQAWVDGGAGQRRAKSAAKPRKKKTSSRSSTARKTKTKTKTKTKARSRTKSSSSATKKSTRKKKSASRS